ncbi:trans-sulfuration enzyme family protein [Halobacillus amylolyticus]|uniref:PLP-dependent aspartate aminotransferase family protein n=1 Tax=Halobacillus amylolyticus TaxID=2932259 RepID=A0ABY4H6D8_9BACI|nr:PLP-dependent aspartate aminotransferase family protein [Halobacillus amylolyticus]UOR10419.1 PLP-dependent aspartate aminotransferase family protein [Halobacillus amylolyticus]
MSHQSFDTRIVHNKINQGDALNSKSTPIYQTSSFTFKDLDHLESYYAGEASFSYSREKNPNTEELGQTVANLEGAEAGVAASSGTSAILAGILSVVQAGDHIVAAEDLYGGTHHLITKELTSFGFEVSIVSFADKKKVEEAIQPNTKLLYTESVSNPFLRVEDLEGLVSLAKEHDLYTMVDNTFATPYLLQPYKKGIDIVVHSATKYIGGHSDVTSGIVVGNEELMAKAKQKVSALGANLSAFEAWLTQRGVKTLGLRMKQQSANAQTLAESLQQDELVDQVFYPEYVSEQGHGAIVTIELSKKVDIEQFFRSLGWIKLTPTLGGLETTVSYPIRTSHRALTDEERALIGVNDYVIRLSIGIEESADIIAQFKEAIHESVKENSQK